MLLRLFNRFCNWLDSGPYIDESGYEVECNHGTNLTLIEGERCYRCGEKSDTEIRREICSLLNESS